jgi:hypothetical protein
MSVLISSNCHRANNFSFPAFTDTVLFDNSYSYFKSKKLTYSVVVTTPFQENEKSATKIEEKNVDQNENDITCDTKEE